MPSDPLEVTGTLLEVATRYIERLMTTAGPRVVVIDDLHWLDPSSIGMVELLADTTTRHPLVVLAGSRTGRSRRGPSGPVCGAWTSGPAGAETARLATLVARADLDADGARASTSGPAATRCSSARPCAPTSRTARSNGGTDASRWSSRPPPGCRSPFAPSSARASMPSIRCAPRPRVASVIGIRFDTTTVALAAGDRSALGSGAGPPGGVGAHRPHRGRRLALRPSAHPRRRVCRPARQPPPRSPLADGGPPRGSARAGAAHDGGHPSGRCRRRGSSAAAAA